MKITKRQLRRIIKEEKHKLVNENVWARGESASALLAFGRAYAGLGSKVQEQVDAVRFLNEVIVEEELTA